MKEKLRYVAIDYGKVRCGMAIEAAGVPLPHKTLPTEALLPYLIEYSKGREIGIVFGLPLHLDGKESPMSQEVRGFAEAVSAYFPVFFCDERLTSRAADALLRIGKTRRKKRTEKKDQNAAVLILQTFLA